MLAKEVQLFIWHQLFKQKKEQDGTISGPLFLDSCQAEFRAPNSSFAPSWKEAFCALLTGMFAYLMYWNWWAGLPLCVRYVPSGFPFAGRHSILLFWYGRLCENSVDNQNDNLLLQLGGDPDEGARCLRKRGIHRLLGRNRISWSHKGPCPGSQAFHQTLLQQLDPQQHCWCMALGKMLFFWSLPLFSF